MRAVMEAYKRQRGKDLMDFKVPKVLKEIKKRIAPTVSHIPQIKAMARLMI